jgi:3-amino-5-hydroxybenzoate synthase
MTNTATLALHGGPPIRTAPFASWPQSGQGERDNLDRVLEQGQWWRTTGEQVRLFEEEFAAFHGAPRALAVTNGTNALELALDIAGVARGNEVVVPAFTFISTSMAVQRIGATPTLADVDLDTYCMTPDTLAAGLTSATTAAIPVHLAGHICDMDGLGTVASGRGITLIQDAAHAHGAVRRGRRVGEHDSLAIFSFQNGKLMTAGEGGAVTFASDADAEEAFLRHNCGRPADDILYRHEALGSNHRMCEFSAAVLRAQLARLPEQIARRERHARRLYAALAALDGIVPLRRDSEIDVNPHYMAMFRVDPTVHPDLDRTWLVRALVAEGIPAFVAYPPVYRTAAFWLGPVPDASEQELALACPNAERIGAEGVWLHHRVLLGDEHDVDDVARAVEKVLEPAPTRRAQAAASG